jgi:hypothetical protein
MNTRLTSFKARSHQFPIFNASPQCLTGTCLGFKILYERFDPLVSQDMLPVPSECLKFPGSLFSENSIWSSTDLRSLTKAKMFSSVM